MTPTILHLPISRTLLDEKRTLLAAAGFPIPADSGSLTFKGIDFTYFYDGTTLTLTITKKPNLMPMGLIKSQLAKWMGVQPVEEEKV